MTNKKRKREDDNLPIEKVEGEDLFWLQKVFQTYLKVNHIDNMINAFKNYYFREGNSHELTIFLFQIIANKDGFTKYICQWQEDGIELYPELESNIRKVTGLLGNVCSLYYAEHHWIETLHIKEDLTEENIDLIRSVVRNAVLKTARELYDQQKDIPVANGHFKEVFDTLTDEQKDKINSIITNHPPAAISTSTAKKVSEKQLSTSS